MVKGGVGGMLANLKKGKLKHFEWQLRNPGFIMGSQ